MSDSPIPDVPRNGAASEPTETPIGSDSVTDLKREVERLRVQLAKASGEAENYRRAAYAMLNQLEPYVPPTEEELHDMLHGPRGRPILEIIAELEEGLPGKPGATDGRG
ncbi:MAG: hypothetical protein C0467_11805 [Planctomycetaceae bacterium]|nr:hypothetical protein [Planctomycetaceae bacterium]